MQDLPGLRAALLELGAAGAGAGASYAGLAAWADRHSGALAGPGGGGLAVMGLMQVGQGAFV